MTYRAPQVLVAQDAPAYIVGPDGVGRLTIVARFTHLVTRFLPILRAAGGDAALEHQLLTANPRRALAHTLVSRLQEGRHSQPLS
ncbi:MAG: hypothetical protein HY332_06935 [Chloroflexi bacterium]|nr:hypothetical protein [Chloroflexota bacterium]